MSQQKQKYYSASELAGLPGLPTTKRRVNARALREAWPSRDRAGLGGGREYPFHVLPPETRDALARALLSDPIAAPQSGTTAVSNEPQTTALPAPGSLHDWQRSCGEARAALLAEVKRIAPAIGMTRAIAALVERAREGSLPAHLQRLVPAANARKGKAGARTLSKATAARWLAAQKQSFTSLAPKPCRKEVAPPAWFLSFLVHFQRPTKPSLAWAIEQTARQVPAGGAKPCATTARYWMRKMSTVDLARGRMGPRELKSVRPFVRRDSSHMWPGDCYTADGHTFDAEVAHPAHGRPFRPEVTAVMDVATRRLVGWSAGLAESTFAVLDAQRNAIERCGIPALWYVDNGSGYVNAVQEDLVVGFAARVGIVITNSLPYNSQARGVIERSHRSVWVRAAKELPTYMGAAMDREARQNVFKLTRKQIKATGVCALLLPWAEFLRFCQAHADAYNNRPHRTLPKVRDTLNGKLRHQTPNEAWEAAIGEGWEPTRVTAEEAADLFRPHKLCTVSRGEVRLFNNLYFDRALADYHGEKVQVGYDIHDASRVWVRDASRRLICVAQFEANSRAYFPQAVIDQAKERRAQGRIARAQVRIEEAEAELRPAALLEHIEANVIEEAMPALAPAGAEPLSENVVALRGVRRPNFDTDPEKYRWLLAHEAETDDEDRGWLAWYQDTEEWFDLFGVGSRRASDEDL